MSEQGKAWRDYEDVAVYILDQVAQTWSAWKESSTSTAPSQQLTGRSTARV